jgi:predicted transposase/invertase (TIGR01784 family)
MASGRRIMSFDWALKTVLRDKANFDVLEGFLSALLKQRVSVEELLESESNQESDVLKQNRVDVLAKLASGEQVVIEVQYSFETGYLRRVLYGAAKVIVENLARGEPYRNVKKVISVSLIHFGFGHGRDYVYHGRTEIRGIHQNDLMEMNEDFATYGEEKDPEWESDNVFPEFYFIPIKRFGDVVKDDLDEWIYAFKNERVLPTFKSRNIRKLDKKLDVLKMPEEEKRRYESYLLRRASDEGVIDAAERKGEKRGVRKGIKRGLEKGIEKGRQEEREEIARNLLDVLDDETIAGKTGLAVGEVRALRNGESHG